MHPSQTRGPARPAREAPLQIPDFTPIPIHERVDWRSVSTEAILTGDQLPHVDLPARLVALLEHCWKAVSVTKGTARGPLQMGANKPHQQPNANSWKPEDIIAAKKYQERMTPYAKAVNPTQKLHENKGGLFDDMPVTPAAKQGIANDWQLMKPLERVSAFTFRGDARGPAAIAAANGFFPPVTRTDDAYVNSVIFPQFESYLQRRFQMKITRDEFQAAFLAFKNQHRSDVPYIQAYFLWRAQLDHEALHIPRMVVFEALKGYISTSRAISVAWEFSFNKNGWVYLTRVRGGYRIPTAAQAEWVGDYEREHEIALPGQLPWDDIFAFRKAGSPKFVGPLYVRNGLREKYPGAWEKVLRAFSAV